jgi:predicted NBD/HSP70 family sugar kinase
MGTAGDIDASARGPVTRHGRSLSGTNLARAGDYNQRVTLQAIRVHGSITRTELAELTGLTAPAIANITKRLLQEGLIIGRGRVQGGRGQPPTLLTINTDGCFSIGVNIDRDHITIVVLDLVGNVRARATLETDFALPQTVEEFFRSSVESMLAVGDFDRERLIGVGVAIPDRLSTIELPLRPAEYSQWDTVDIPSLFTPIVPGPVLIENDATAAAMGELQFGHGLRQSSFFYILLAAGLGGGLVINGVQYRGAHGRSGEIGFLPLRSPRTPAPDLGQVASLQGIYDFFRRAGHPLSRPEALLQLPSDTQALIAEWVDLSADVLADTLVTICCVLDPQAIYIGGRMPAEIVDRLADRLNQVLPVRGNGIPVIAPVRRAAMALDAPAVGAALLPFNERLLPTREALMKIDV